MAADPKPDWLSCLPSSWSYGVTRDGRIFFINEEAKSTTWLHPVTGEAVITGHRKTPDLPTGWEEGYTFEGARCFINVTCGSIRDTPFLQNKGQRTTFSYITTGPHFTVAITQSCSSAN
ncbi:pleckstrin homology domain-containing family A member 5-like isoform X10 [Xiphias gladius]|uniref:pleckstrin homology domain-containing family A member 5-like isoform X10 n=1 Tax=Xiphias gladius TaxID=8245 RepID=UPI001A991ED1|nr:pleckstrin homology domain-containing family A member 5-like isoform X10 [Xiphias gladius]